MTRKAPVRTATLAGHFGEVAALVAGRDAEIDRAGRLPPDIIDSLRRTRLFSMLVEEDFGGLGLELPVALRVVEDLAALSASVAWVLSVGAAAAYWTTALVDDEVATLVHPDAASSVITSTPGPAGQAERESGGWRLSGRWAFASGSAHADWFAVGCRLVDDNGPLPGPGGYGRFASFLVPAARVRIEDTWHVTGLRGTASNDLVIGRDDDVVVPEKMSFNHLSDPPRRAGHRYSYIGLAHALVPAVSVGIARGAVQDALAICGAKQDPYGGPPTGSRPFAQLALGRAAAKSEAARCLLHDAVDDAWSAAAGGRPADAVRARVRAACTFAVETSAEATALARDAVGSSGVYETCPLELRFRDVSTAATHVGHRPATYADAAALHLGTYSSPLAIF